MRKAAWVLNNPGNQVHTLGAVQGKLSKQVTKMHINLKIYGARSFTVSPRDSDIYIVTERERAKSDVSQNGHPCHAGKWSGIRCDIENEG